MMWKSFILPIFIMFVYTVKSEDEIAVCPAENEYIKFSVSNYIRFQSPNYPSSMYGHINSTCNVSFVPETNGDYLWLTILNGAFTNPFINDGLTNSTFKYYFQSNYDVTTFTSTSGIINFELLYHHYGMDAYWDAFDAVVLSFSPSSASECPFSDQIITMDNETIIPISSDFGVSEIFTNKNCSWNFKNIDPENFQFKVYIKQLIYPYSLVLSNMYFDGNVTIDDPQVRYFNGSDLTIMSINDNNDTKVSNGFFAIISLVPIKANYNEECQVQANDNGTIAVSNIDYENGYKPFSTCSYNISIPTGHEAILLVSEYFLEAGVDKLTVSKDNESFELRNYGYFKIKKEFNGSIFKFIADGNTQQAGFSGVYRTIECKCADPNFVIPCDGYSSLYPLLNNAAFCDHQDCNYTISLDKNCTKDFFTIEPFSNPQNTSWLAIYVNENLTQNCTYCRPDEILPYPRNTNITVVFHSGQSSSPFFFGLPGWRIGTKAISSPKITSKIQLNSTSQTFAIYLDNVEAEEAFTVCSPSDDVLELFITKGKNMNVFDLYDSDDLNNFVDTLEGLTINKTSTGSSVYKITSKSGCFTIYCAEKDTSTLGTVFFRMQKAHTKNCNTNQNIVGIFQNSPATTFTVDANMFGSCEMIIFAENKNVASFLVLNNLQTSSYGYGLSFSFSSGLNGNPYFDIPYYALDLWKQVMLYTPILNVVAPPLSSLTLNISDDPNTALIESGEYKGVLVSPKYSGVNYPDSVEYGLHLKYTESANFIVKNLSSDANVILQNKLTNEKHMFFANESYFTNGSEFYLHGNNCFRIEYTFDVLPHDPATTTTTTAVTQKTSSTTPPSTTTTTTTLANSSSTTPPKIQATTTSITPSTHKNGGFISSYNIGTLFVWFALCFIPYL